MAIIVVYFQHLYHAYAVKAYAICAVILPSTYHSTYHNDNILNKRQFCARPQKYAGAARLLAI